MIPLVEGMQNTIKVQVETSVDIEGFTAVLAACGVLKTISDLTVEGIKIDFSAEEVASANETGTFGTFQVYDADGNLYMEFLPVFKLIPNDKAPLAIGNQTLYITIASTKVPEDLSDSGGGGGGDMSKYATKKEVSNALQEANQYTDDQISDIGDVIITTQPVPVQDAEGHPTTMTVQEAVQNVVNVQSAVDHASKTYLTGSVVDEDGDGQPDNETLYFHPEVSSRKRISSSSR